MQGLARVMVAATCLAAHAGWAESVVLARTVPAQTVLTADDLVLVASDIPGALQDPGPAIGQETRIALYAGRPLRAGDFGAAASVERNQVVPLLYQTASLDILTEGRALERGGTGDVIRVMNISSRNTVWGEIGANGQVRVATADERTVTE